MFGRLIGGLDSLRRFPDLGLGFFDSFFRGVRRGCFPQLNDRDNLWRLLVTLTARKAFDQVREERTQKRGGGAIRGESDLCGADSAAVGFEQVVSREPTPEFAAQVAEEYRRLLDMLADTELRSVALWKMEGYTVEEIAAQLGCVPRTVERKLRAIRELWGKEMLS